MSIHCHSASQEWWSTSHGAASPPLRWIKTLKTAFTHCTWRFPRLFFLSDNKVLIVIGKDTYYQNKDEKARSVISRWAKRKVASQFGEEYLDGRQSFIFSWNEKHRLIHEEAMRHYLDPEKRGSKFEYTPPKPLPKTIEPKVYQPLPKPIPPVDPRPASADTDLSREVGDNLLLPLNSRNN